MKKVIFKGLLCTILTVSLLLPNSIARDVQAETAAPMYSMGLRPDTSTKSATIPTKKFSTAAALPASVDLSSMVPAPGSQGSQGSCAAWAVAYAKSYQEKKEFGATWDLTKSNYIMSPSFIYNQIHANEEAGGGGSSFEEALWLLTNVGSTSLAVMPYSTDAYGFQIEPSSSVKASAYKYRIKSWNRVPNGDYNEARGYLANGVPVLIGIDVHPDFLNLNSSNPIYNDISGENKGGHGLCVVGYDDSKRAVKVINSWTTSWGINGYGWISYDLIASQNYPMYVMTDEVSSMPTDFYANAVASRDINGDGKFDIITQYDYYGYRHWIGRCSENGAFKESTYWTSVNLATCNASFVAAEDVNGDGKSDLIIQYDDSSGVRHWQARCSDGTKFIDSGDWATSATNTPSTGTVFNFAGLKDVDGDGKADLILQYDYYGYRHWQVRFSNGIRFVDGRSCHAITTRNDNTTVLVGIADFNGDGKNDLLTQYTDASGISHWKARCFDGTAFSDPSDWATSATNRLGPGSGSVFAAVGFGDVNGDGKDDLTLQSDYYNFRHWQVRCSDGTKFVDGSKFWAYTHADKNGTLLAMKDMEGKGKDEMILQFDYEGVRYWQDVDSTINGGFVGDPEFFWASGEPTDKVIGIGDVNFNPSPDLIIEYDLYGNLKKDYWCAISYHTWPWFPW